MLQLRRNKQPRWSCGVLLGADEAKCGRTCKVNGWFRIVTIFTPNLVLHDSYYTTAENWESWGTNPPSTTTTSRSKSTFLARSH